MAKIDTFFGFLASCIIGYGLGYFIGWVLFTFWRWIVAAFLILFAVATFMVFAPKATAFLKSYTWDRVKPRRPHTPTTVEGEVV